MGAYRKRWALKLAMGDFLAARAAHWGLDIPFPLWPVVFPSPPPSASLAPRPNLSDGAAVASHRRRPDPQRETHLQR